MSAEQLAAMLDRPLWQVQKALQSLLNKGLIEQTPCPLLPTEPQGD